MDVYYKLKENQDIEYCVSQLLYNIDGLIKEKKGKISLSTWDSIYRYGLDGYIVNIAVCILKTGFKNSEHWEKQFSSCVFPILEQYGLDKEFEKYNIIKNVWNAYYVDNVIRNDSQGSIVKDIAISYGNFFVRNFSNNFTLISVFILCFIMSWISLGESEFQFLIWSIGIVLSVFIWGITKKYASIFFIPLIFNLIGVVWYLIEPVDPIFFEDNYLKAKECLYTGISFFPMLIVGFINNDRLTGRLYNSNNNRYSL